MVGYIRFHVTRPDGYPHQASCAMASVSQDWFQYGVDTILLYLDELWNLINTGGYNFEIGTMDTYTEGPFGEGPYVCRFDTRNVSDPIQPFAVSVSVVENATIDVNISIGKLVDPTKTKIGACPIGTHFDIAQKKCVADSTSKTNGGTTPPPTGGGPPSPPSGLDALDVTKWIKWIGDTIAYWLNLLLTTIWNGLLDALRKIYAALPQSWRDAIHAFNAAIVQFESDLRDPVGWFKRFTDSLFKRSSQSYLDIIVSEVRKTILYALFGQALGDKILAQPIGDTGTTIEAIGREIGKEISVATVPESAEARIAVLDGLVSPLFLTTLTAQSVAESIPTLNKTGSASLASAWLEARGIYSIVKGEIEPYLKHNIQKMLDYHLNEFYHNELPDLSTQISMRNRGYYSPDVYIQQAGRVSGIDHPTLEQLRRLSLSPPDLIDYITFNRRYPQSTIDLATIAEKIGLNWEEYRTIFQERQYIDIGRRDLQYAHDLGKLTADQVKYILTLNGIDPRPNVVLGMSQVDLLTSTIVDKKDTTYSKTALTAKTTNYIAGLADRTAVEAIAKRAIISEQARADYLSAVDDKAQLQKTQRENFTYTLLIKMAEKGVDISKIYPKDIDNTKFDDDHKAALKSYIEAMIAANAAKAKTSSATSPSTTPSPA